jgi:hypothetical protein
LGRLRIKQGKKRVSRGWKRNRRGGALAAALQYRHMSDAPPSGKFSNVGSTLGAGAGTAFRLLKGKPGRNKRWFRGFQSGAAAFAKTMAGTLRVLFLEVSGFIFICFTAMIVSAFFREYRKYAMHQVGMERVILAAAISAMFFYFGLSSFWRARRKRSKIS